MEKVASPCMSICALDGDDVCIGCFRTGREITYWGRLSEDGRREVVRRCGLRMSGDHQACWVDEHDARNG